MIRVVQWLRKIEQLASSVYYQAATLFSDDQKLKQFLERLAEEEDWHYNVMGNAADYISSDNHKEPAVIIDSDTNNRVVNYFTSMQQSMEQQSLTRDALFEKILEAELSEWNHIFLYVVNSLKNKSSEFSHAAAKMQSHIKGIAYYIEKEEKKTGVIDKVNSLTRIWVEKILVVDDEPLVADLVKNLLYRDGAIDIARNGNEALEFIDKKYYKLIISDIDMPEMDGLTLFKEAVSKYPKLESRFLFMTGDLSLEKNSFFNEHKIKCLPKPMNIKTLKDEALKVLLSE